MICYESGPYCGLCYNYDIGQVQQCDLDQFPLILMHGKHNTGRKLRIRKQSEELTKNSSARYMIHGGYEVAFEEILDSRTSNWILPEEFNLIQVFFSHHVVHGWCNRKKLES